MAQKGDRLKTTSHQRGLIAAVITLVILWMIWWLAYRWFEASLLAEAAGQQAVVARSVQALQLVGLLVVSLGTTLAYFLTSRETRLVQTIQSQEVELLERAAQYRSVFETTSDALVIRDLETLIIVDANPAYCTLYRSNREALLGQSNLAAAAEMNYRQYVEQIRQAGQHRWEKLLTHPDGSIVYLEARGTIITHLGQPYLLVALRDVTERVQARQLLEQRVAARTRELETLLQVSRALSETLDLKALLNRILEQLRRVVEFEDAGMFDLIDEEHLGVLVYAGPDPAGHLVERWPLAEAPLHALIIQQQQALIVPDTLADTPQAAAWRESQWQTALSAHSWMGVPLQFKNQTMGLLAMGHSQSNFYTPHHVELALAFAGQTAIALENARLYEQAQALASLEERRHLARELHDSVSQALYGIALGTRTARMQLDRDPGKLVEPLDYIMNLAEAGLSEMRALIFELRPEVLEAEGLVAALRKQGEALAARHKLKVMTHFDEEPSVPLTVKEALYRIAQEATHNIVKHARAGQVELALFQVDGLTLEIKDDGQGFDPQASFSGHLGLHSMRERAEKLGGRFELFSQPGQGTTVRVWLPVKSSI
jgi:PAS domain S-box-containing protein